MLQVPVIRLAMAAAFGTALLAASTAQAGTLYKWVDERGNVIYSDEKPPEGAAQVEERDDAYSGEQQGKSINQLVEESPIVLYSTPDCDACGMMREYLNETGLPYTEVNVADDVAAQEQMRGQVGSLSVPSLAVGDRVLTGYNRGAMETLLDVAGYPVTPAAAAPTGAATDQEPAAEGEETPVESAAPSSEPFEAPAPESETDAVDPIIGDVIDNERFEDVIGDDRIEGGEVPEEAVTEGGN